MTAHTSTGAWAGTGGTPGNPHAGAPNARGVVGGAFDAPDPVGYYSRLLADHTPKLQQSIRDAEQRRWRRLVLNNSAWGVVALVPGLVGFAASVVADGSHGSATWSRALDTSAAWAAIVSCAYGAVALGLAAALFVQSRREARRARAWAEGVALAARRLDVVVRRASQIEDHRHAARPGDPGDAVELDLQLAEAEGVLHYYRTVIADQASGGFGPYAEDRGPTRGRASQTGPTAAHAGASAPVPAGVVSDQSDTWTPAAPPLGTTTGGVRAT